MSSFSPLEKWRLGERFALPEDPCVVLNILSSSDLEVDPDGDISAQHLRHFAVSVEELPRVRPQLSLPVVVSPGSSPGAPTTVQFHAAPVSPPPLFDVSVSCTYDDPDLRRSLPFDVAVLCHRGGVVRAHRFVLVYQSEFFRTRFRAGGGANFGPGSTGSVDNNVNNNGVDDDDDDDGDGDDLNDLERVDLSGCPHATHSVVETAVKMLYKGCASLPFLRLSDLMPMMYLADYLRLSSVSSFCQGVLSAVLRRAAPDFVMMVSGVAEQLAVDGLMELVENRLMQLREEPAELNQVSLRTMFALLECPEKFSFASLNPISGMSVLAREKHLLHLALSFLAYDLPARLPHAADLLSRIRLAYVVNRLGDEELCARGLADLKKDGRVRALLVQAELCRAVDDFYATNLPVSLWQPRPGSFKYSFWTTKRFGSIRFRRSKGDSPEMVARIRSYKPWTVTMARCSDDARIAAIDVSTRLLDGHEVIDGLALHWTDGSKDGAGALDRRFVDKSGFSPGGRRHRVHLASYEGVQPRVVAGDLIRNVLFVTTREAHHYSGGSDAPSGTSLLPDAVFFTPERGTVDEDGRRRWGPFGTHRNMGGSVRFDHAVGSCKYLDVRCFLDGLKVTSVMVGEAGKRKPVLTGLRFKMSVMADGPMEHLTSEMEKHPTLNVTSAERPREMPKTRLKRAIVSSSSLSLSAITQ